MRKPASAGLALALALALLLGPGAGAQSLSSEGTLKRLARFEIIAVGAFPLAFFFTNLGFDLAAFVSNDFNSLYAPWPFRNAAAPIPPASERRTRITVGVSLASLLAMADFLLERPGKAPSVSRSPAPGAGAQLGGGTALPPASGSTGGSASAAAASGAADSSPPPESSADDTTATQ